MPKLVKLIILVFITINICGCNSSYKNLDDLAIVSSFLVDKDKNNNYKVYIEIYKEEKSENKSKKESYFVSGKGTNLRSAITDASNSVSKTLYFNHINAVVFSEYAIDNNLNYMFNYLEKRIQVNSNYYLLISDNIENIMKHKDEDNPILGEKVKYLLENSTNNGAMINYDLLEKLSYFVTKDKDIFLSKIDLFDKNIVINGGYYFKGEKIVGQLNTEEIRLLNLFKNQENIYFNFDYENNNYYVLKIDTCKVSYDFKNGINIKLNIKANIDSAASNINLKNLDVIDKLNNHSSSSIERRLNKLIEKLKINKSDLLGINTYIYKYNGYKKFNFFENNTNITVDLVINKKGLVNNTIGGNNE